MHTSTLSAASKPWTEPRTSSSSLETLCPSLLSALPDASPSAASTAPYSYLQAAQASFPTLHLSAPPPPLAFSPPSSASTPRGWLPTMPSPSPSLPPTAAPHPYDGLYTPSPFVRGPSYTAYDPSPSSFASPYPPPSSFGYAPQSHPPGPLFGHPHFPPPPPFSRRQSSGAGWRGRGRYDDSRSAYPTHVAAPSDQQPQARPLQHEGSGHAERQLRLEDQPESVSHSAPRGAAAAPPSAGQAGVNTGPGFGQPRSHPRALHVDTASFDRREKKPHRVAMFTLPIACVLPLELRREAHLYQNGDYPYYSPYQLVRPRTPLSTAATTASHRLSHSPIRSCAVALHLPLLQRYGAFRTQRQYRASQYSQANVRGPPPHLSHIENPALSFPQPAPAVYSGRPSMQQPTSGASSTAPAAVEDSGEPSREEGQPAATNSAATTSA